MALVETFAGKRTYYIYLEAEFDVPSLMTDVEASFPQEDISWKIHNDPTWRLFNGYAGDFGFA